MELNILQNFLCVNFGLHLVIVLSLKKLKMSFKLPHSFGCDKVPTNLLKSCSCFINSLLNYICNKTLFSGVLSDRLKYEIIRPLFKKGNKNDISSNMPILILTLLSKPFEKVMQNRLLKYLYDYNILSKEQHGFRTKLKTVNATYQ